MGREARQSQEKVKLGKYNVAITLVYLDDTVKEYQCKSWQDVGTKLALDLDDNMLMIINIAALKYFVVTPQAELDA
jgi:hypothetical protein